MPVIAICWGLVVLLALSASHAVAQEGKPATPEVALRCGWFVNPHPGTTWLWDKDGEWTVGEQGGWQATGDYPAFKRGQWVQSSGLYGAGCACLKAVFDP